MPKHPSDVDSMLRHVVLFAFKAETSEEEICQVEEAFRRLPAQIDEIHDFEWGTDASVEGKSHGYSHCFMVTFLSEEDRDAYLPHPAHREFGNMLRPHVESVLVVDYWSGR
jgi:hypothetical protein